MSDQNGNDHDPDDNKSSFVVVPSTKPKSTREVETQTENVPLTINITGEETNNTNAQNGVSTNAHNRRPSISRRRNVSLTLSPSPKMNQEFQLPLVAAPPVDPCDDRHLPTPEQRIQRKTSMPSRPSDLRLLFSNNDSAQRRVVDGRNIGSANESFFERDTEEVVENFMVFSYERDTRNSVFDNASSSDVLLSPGSVHDTPNIPELQHVNNPLSPTAMVARRLVRISDELETRYGPELDHMVLRVLPEFLLASSGLGETVLGRAFEVFRNVASRIFECGIISWSRIVTLMSFGYRMGVTLFRQGIVGFVSLVVPLVTRYIMESSVRRWIIQSGGWFASLTFRLTNDNDLQNQIFLGLIWGATAAVLTTIICRNLFK